MRNKILLGLVAIALTAIVVSNVYAQCEPPLPPPCGTGLSPGYWKHNVKVYNGGPGSFSGDPHETRTTMENYEALIAAYLHPGFTLEWANEMFQDNANKDMWLTIANWFNAASGRAPYSD